ncbi:unnamed protein product, partial [Ilex paraguariensis]
HTQALTEPLAHSSGHAQSWATPLVCVPGHAQYLARLLAGSITCIQAAKSPSLSTHGASPATPNNHDASSATPDDPGTSPSAPLPACQCTEPMAYSPWRRPMVPPPP